MFSALSVVIVSLKICGYRFSFPPNFCVSLRDRRAGGEYSVCDDTVALTARKHSCPSPEADSKFRASSNAPAYGKKPWAILSYPVMPKRRQITSVSDRVLF